MATPTINDLQAVDPVLTNLLVGYMQVDARFVASRLAPSVPVDKDSGTYYIATKKYWFLNEMKQRAPGNSFARGGFGVETATYLTLQWGLEFPIPDENKANSQLPMELQTLGLKWLANQSNIRKEISFAADFMATSVWGTDNTTATDWDDFASGDPVDNVLTAKRTVSNNTGYDPNTMALGYIVHQALVNHPDVLDRIKYTTQANQGNVESALAALFGLSDYVVGKATYSNTNEAAAFSATAIIDDDALITYVNPGAGVFDVTALKTFAWAGGGGLGAVTPYRDQRVKSDILQHQEQWDQKVVASDLGYFFSDIV